MAITMLEQQQARWFWNEIARNQGLKRGVNKKVVRGKVGIGSWDGEARGRYEQALEGLEHAVKGEGKDKER